MEDLLDRAADKKREVKLADKVQKQKRFNPTSSPPKTGKKLVKKAEKKDSQKAESLEPPKKV